MQHSVEKFAEACHHFGLTFSLKQITVLHQAAPEKAYDEPNITINGKRLNAVEKKIAYLGSTLCVVIDDEVNARLA